MDDELKVFRDSLPDLRRWQQRAKQLEQPEPGSDLAEDDAAFPHQLISETVRISLVSAGEHLRLVWDGLECGNYYNMSQYSAVRAAIVGAAQAVWVLASDDSTIRRERGHIVITETDVQGGNTRRLRAGAANRRRIDYALASLGVGVDLRKPAER